MMTSITRTALAVLAGASVVSGVGRTVAAQTVEGDLDPRIVKLVGSVSEERLGAILKKLESFETRSSLSSTTSTTRGIGAARQWILDEMKSYSPKLQVSFDVYQVPPQGRITRPVELRERKSPIARIAIVAETIVAACASDSRTSPRT